MPFRVTIEEVKLIDDGDGEFRKIYRQWFEKLDVARIVVNLNTVEEPVFEYYRPSAPPAVEEQSIEKA